jgi:hypothetical protein
MISESEGIINEASQIPKEKRNYCDGRGNCTVEHYPDERNCLFYAEPESPLAHFCLVFICGECMSPEARTAARQAAD